MTDTARAKQLLYLVWSMPLLRLVERAGVYNVVLQDVRRWYECMGWREDGSDAARFAVLVAKFPEFRNLVHYRIGELPALWRLAARTIWRNEKTLHIHCDSVGAGLFIQHGFATTITAHSIGRDCWINQQVTIGHTTKGQPVIGDRVQIAAGAVVVGPVNVGDDATIGVNATVVKSVPSGVTMVAPQAQQLTATPSNILHL
jgi:serine O-acetyltransferase